MGLTWQKNPNPKLTADLQRAARGYLQQFLKTDPDRLQITARGLVPRGS